MCRPRRRDDRYYAPLVGIAFLLWLGARLFRVFFPKREEE